MRFIATPLLRGRFGVCLLFICYSFLIALCGSLPPLAAQSLSFFNLDASNFPRMRANVYAFDSQGRQITSRLNFNIAEDGVQRAVASYDCPVQQAKPVSAVLTIDISGSMGVPFNGTTRLEIAKGAATAFVDALAADGSECGIVAFETNSYPFQDFTADKTRLKQVIGGLSPLFGTNYQAAFLANPGGALTMLARAKNSNRAVIFLTDGLSTAVRDQVILQAKQVGATVYCITIGFPVPQILDTIARATGGQAFSNVQSKAEAEQIYRELANRIRLNTPCAIEWTTDLPCRSDARSVVLTTSALPGVSASLSYVPPVSLESQVGILPRAVAMGSVAIGQSVQLPVSMQLNAGAQDLVIRRIRSNDNAFRVLEQNFTLLAGQPPRPLNVQYTAQDSGYRFATLTVETDNGCTFDFYATSGFPGIRPATRTLVLTHPNGGETFLVGTDTVITWKGLPPTEEARLDYSIDAGKTWIKVDDAAKTLRRTWHVPDTPSDNCLMRVQQKNTSGAAYFGDSAVALMGHRQSVEVAQFNSTGDRIISISGQEGLYWYGKDSTLGQQIRKLPFATRAYYATFNNRNEAIIGGDNTDENIIATIGQIPDNPLTQIPIAVISAFGQTAIRHLSANPMNPNRFLIVTNSPNGGIFIHDKSLPDNDVRKFIGRLPTSDGSLVFNARYTPQLSTIDNNNKATLLSGIIGAMRGVQDGVRLWLFSGDERNIIKQISWASNARPVYVDATNDPARQGNLRIAVACEDNRVRFLTVVPDNGNLRLEQDMTIPEMLHQAPITMLSFDPSGNFLVTVSGNQALIWQIGKTAPETILNSPQRHPHKAPINTAFFSPDGNRVVTASKDNDTNVVVWFVRTPLPLQEDKSDALWRIVRPHLVGNDVNVGQAIVGADKDTTHLVLTNPDPYSVPITKVWLKNPNGPFSIVNGDAPFTVNALGRYSIEFRFHPLVEGSDPPNTDSIFYQTISGDTIKARISGVGVFQRIQISAQSIDWHERFVGVGHDTVQAVIRNISPVPVTLSVPSSPSGVFRVLGVTLSARSINNAGIITLAAGDSIIVNLRFTPTYIGIIGAPLPFTTNQPGDPPTVQLLGTGVQAGPRLSSTIAALPMVQAPCDAVQKTIDIALPNTGTEALVISSISVVGSDGLPSSDFQVLTQTPITVQVNDQGSMSARIRFTPQAVGTTYATLLIRSNSISGDMRIPLQGRWERPVLVFSTRSIVFPTVAEKQPSSPITITVQNKGNTSVSWFNMPTVFPDRDGIERLRVIASPESGALSSNATSSLTLTFLGGAAGVTYRDIVGFLEPGKCFFDSVQWSATVQSSPRLTINPPQPLTTCLTSASVSVSVQNNGSAVAKDVRFTILPPLPNVKLLDSIGTIATGSTFTVRLDISPLARAETTRFSLVIESTTSTVTASETIKRDTVPITVIKYDVGLRLSRNAIVFPMLDAGIAAQDTVTIYNPSNQPLAIPQQFLGRTAPFMWQAPALIPPYGSAVASVRFNGAAAGLVFQDSILFTPTFVNGVECLVATQMLRVNASTTPPSTADLLFTNAFAAPGDTTEVKVYLLNRARIPLGTIISDTLRYNVSLLLPLPPLQVLKPTDGVRKVPLRFEVTNDDPAVPLAVLRFRAALGNDTATALNLTFTPEMRAAKMTINASTATFRLIGIARAGGLRLVTSSIATLKILDARPNPASSELTIEYSSGEAEEHTLYLINALGIRPDPAAFPEQRFMSVKGVNTRVLDVSRLPSGTYFLQLRNAREIAARKIIIIR